MTYCDYCGYEISDHKPSQNRYCRKMIVARAIGNHIEKHVDTQQIIRPKTLDDFIEESTLVYNPNVNYHVYPTKRLDKVKPKKEYQSSYGF